MSDNAKREARFRINVEITPDDIQLMEWEDALALIRAIDLSQASYDFTAKCRDYFVAEIAKEDSIASLSGAHDEG